MLMFNRLKFWQRHPGASADRGMFGTYARNILSGKREGTWELKVKLLKETSLIYRTTMGSISKIRLDRISNYLRGINPVLDDFTII